MLPRLVRGSVRLSRYYRGVHHIARKLNADAVIAHNYDVLPIGAALARSRVPLVYYCMEYADPQTAADYLIGWGFLKAIEAPLVRLCSLVISVEENRARLQSEHWRRAVDHVAFNTPTYDENFHRTASEAVKTQHEKLRCVFAGRIDRRNHIARVLKAIDDVPDATLDLWGLVPESFKSELSRLLSTSSAAAAGRVNYRGTTPYDQLKRELLGYDVGLSLYESSDSNTTFASPSKIGEYMRSGLAVISPDQPLPRAIIEDAHCGRVFCSANLGGLAAYLQGLADHPERVTTLRTRALEAFRTQYNYDRQIQPLLQYLSDSADMKHACVI